MTQNLGEKERGSLSNVRRMATMRQINILQEIMLYSQRLTCSKEVGLAVLLART